MKYLPISFLLTVSLFSGFSCGTHSAGLSFDELRLRQKIKITGGDLDLNDTVVIQRLTAMDSNIRTYWDNMNKDSGRTFLWDDPECQDDSISPFRPASVTTPISRLSTMAVAYATKGSVFYGNTVLKQDIIEGMEWMYSHKWNPACPMYGNWWDWIIGMPGSVNNLLTVMYDDFTPEQRARYIEALDYYAPGVTYEGASTGANKIWQCSSMVLRGILSHNSNKIQMGVDGIGTEFKFVDRHDGFYKDGSYMQHQWHPYTGGYGASFLRDLVYLMEMVHGSQWEIGTSHLDMLCEWLGNAYLPLIVDGAMMDMVRGREIARQAVSDRTTGHTILLNAYNISKMADDKVKIRLQSRIKYEMLSDKWRDFISQDAPLWQLAELRAFLNDDQIPAQAPVPFYHQFSAMDRVVHVRPGFALGLAMSSGRIENYESIDSENMMSWHTGDGMMYLYNGDQAQYTDHYWSTVDYYRLPGITVDAGQQHEVKSLVFGEGILYADGYKSPQSWVGGAAIDESFGICGMWFADGQSTLEAKKTWMMVGDEIAALGAGINSTDNRTIETIIDNRKITGVPRIVVEDEVMREKKWANTYDTLTIVIKSEDPFCNDRVLTCSFISRVHFETSVAGTGMGYFFPNPAKVNVQKMPRTGSWRNISKYGDPTPVTRDYFTLWFDHGKNPSDATYAYILLPGITVEALKAYAAAPNMEILFNTPQVQAVRAKKEGVTGFNFWEAPASPVAGITVSAPASVILRETGTELLIGIADPTQKEKTITVELDRLVSGITVDNPDIQVLSTRPLLKMRVNVDQAHGVTRVIQFKIEN